MYNQGLSDLGITGKEFFSLEPLQNIAEGSMMIELRDTQLQNPVKPSIETQGVDLF